MEHKKKMRNNKEIKCKMCGTPRGLIRVYGLYICRRCFKDNAPRLGFSKLE